MTQGLIMICAISTMLGFWKVTEGVLGYLFAPTKRGSLADEE